MFWILLGLGGIAGWLVPKIYETSLTTEEKKRFEDWVKLHHGEAGFVFILLGLLLKSPTLLGAGTGLMYHDRKDIPKWFSGDKFKK